MSIAVSPPTPHLSQLTDPVLHVRRANRREALHQAVRDTLGELVVIEITVHGRLKTVADVSPVVVANYPPVGRLPTDSNPPRTRRTIPAGPAQRTDCTSLAAAFRAAGQGTAVRGHRHHPRIRVPRHTHCIQRLE